MRFDGANCDARVVTRSRVMKRVVSGVPVAVATVFVAIAIADSVAAHASVARGADPRETFAAASREGPSVAIGFCTS